MGAPNGVPPRNTARYTAITRPRSCGEVDSCTVALAAVIRVSTDTPTGTSATANSAEVGISAAIALAMPKATVAPITNRTVGRSRRAASNAPPSDPTAITEPISPYPSAPVWNTSLAISAMVSWKFSPNVPTTPTITMVSTMSDRCRTYARPARTAPLPRGTRGATINWSVRIRASDTSTAPNVDALIRNTGPAPSQ